MRYAFGFVFLSPWIVRTRPRLLPDRQLWYHAQCSALTYCGLFASYYSVTVIALADSMALQFTLPVFASLFAFALGTSIITALGWVISLFAGKIVAWIVSLFR